MYDVTAIGELLIDFAPVSMDGDGYPTLAAKPGGAPGNYLAALAAYGMKTAMISKVGDDAFGEKLIGTMQKAGIDTKGIVRDGSAFTTLAFVTLDASGNRSFSFARKPGADTLLRFDEIDLSLIEEAKVFHFGSLSLTAEPIREATQKSVSYAKDLGKIITFDPNLRLPLWDSQEEAKKQILWSLGQADIVKISDDEVEFLWGCDEREGSDILLRHFGVKLAMVTLGPQGCILQNKNGHVFVPCPQTDTIDTTGAGDIFGGSAVSRIMKLDKPLDVLTVGELREIATFASYAASFSTQKPGGIPSIPQEFEILEAMNRGRRRF